MDFSLLNQSKSSSSSEETDQITDETRAYGCIFCKRGFTTAQALGGHMNIHRKERTKPNPSSSSVPPLLSDELTYVCLQTYPPPISSYPPFYHPSYSSAPKPCIGLPVSTANSHYSFPSQVEQFFSSLQVDDGQLNRGGSDEGLVWGQTLNLQGGLSRSGDDHGDAQRHGVSEEDVDLELRLGLVTRSSMT